jgi:formylglycine-generating enzyme required for sulfatase activity
VAAGGCKQKPGDEGWGRGRQPVINVSWEDAQAYVAWLTTKTGKGYRPLSEAEAEYAARAGSTTAYPWGEDPGTNRANFGFSGSQWSDKQTAPVGSFAPNAFGLYDMIGNVWEWTQDCWNDSLYRLRQSTDRHGSRATVAGGWCAAAPGSTDRGARGRPSASGTGPGSGTTTWVSVSPGRSDLLLL